MQFHFSDNHYAFTLHFLKLTLKDTAGVRGILISCIPFVLLLWKIFKILRQSLT
jgi:hypothetical protein